MGRVRTNTVEKAARVIIEKYYRKLTFDFKTNKKIIKEIAVIHSKPLRIRIATATIFELITSFSSYIIKG